MRESAADTFLISSPSFGELLSRIRSSKWVKVCFNTEVIALSTKACLPRVGMTTDTVGFMEISLLPSVMEWITSQCAHSLRMFSSSREMSEWFFHIGALQSSFMAQFYPSPNEILVEVRSFFHLI